MKLLLCPYCNDVRSLFLTKGPLLPPEQMREAGNCRCGRCCGYYTGDLDAVYSRDALMLGFANPSLYEALLDQKRLGDLAPNARGLVMGREFAAFIIPEAAPSVRRQD